MSHSNDKVHSPEIQCKGKRGYSTRLQARRAARRAVKKKLFDYRCPHCGLIHLGHR